ncbi:MAG: hypothetical protein ACJA2S_003974 [Cyclobacteriaceae bacterium]|jgi:hypothetical protein
MKIIYLKKEANMLKTGFYIMLPLLLILLSCFNKPQDEFDKLNESSNWELKFSDSGDKDWQKNWFLDGEIARVEHNKYGMDLIAGPINKNDAHHSVLWTKESFEGDVKIEYNYTRTDDQVINVNIMYIQATGIGTEGFDKDITKWNEYRKVPKMSKYYLNMNTIHISYAAFPTVNEDPKNDYIRVRRYPASEKSTFKKTEVPPSFDKIGLFLPDVTYKMTWIKSGDKLHLKVEGDNRLEKYSWDLSVFPAISEGRIGLRHMYTRSASYSDFKVSIK